MKSWYKYLLLLALSFPLLVAAQMEMRNDTLFIGEKFEKQLAPLTLPLFVDGSFKLQPNFVLQIFDVKSESLMSNKVVQGYVRAAFWHKIHLYNNTDRIQNIVVSVDNPNIDFVEFYIRTGNLLNLVAKAGDHVAHSLWPVHSRVPAYDLRLPPGSSEQLYLKSYNSSSGNVQLPISIRTKNYFNQFQEGFNLIIGLYLGFLMVNISLAFFTIVMLKRSIYFWYGSFLLSLLGYTLVHFGYMYQYITPENTGLNDIIRSYLSILTAICMIRFAQHFLDIKKSLPFLHGVINVSLTILATFIVSSFFMMEYLRENFNVFFPWVTLVILFNYVTLLVAAAFVRKKTPLASNSFLLAFSLSISGVIVLILGDLEIIRYNHWLSYAPWIGNAFEILIFTAILAFQFKLLSDERLSLQAEVAQEKTARLKEFFHGQEKERERVARELHDHVAGTLVGARFLLPSPHQLRDRLDVTQLNFYEKALSALDQSIHDVRNISHQLLPPSFQETSLKLELEKLLSTYRLLSPSTYFSMLFDADESKIPADVAMTLYRITQESLQNTHKHAHASSVWMHICLLNDVLQLRIEDNGKGFDPGKIKQGIGLHNFKSRISAFDGASFKLFASPGSGTRIELDIPLVQAIEVNKKPKSDTNPLIVE